MINFRTQDHSDHDPPLPELSQYQVVYPHYLSSSFSRNQGRRVPKNLSLEKPTALEIAKACEAMKLSHALEPNKLYPRSQGKTPQPFLQGRVRVQLKKIDDVMGEGHDEQSTSFVRNDIYSKRDFLKKLRDQIKKNRSGAETKPITTRTRRDKAKRRK